MADTTPLSKRAMPTEVPTMKRLFQTKQTSWKACTVLSYVGGEKKEDLQRGFPEVCEELEKILHQKDEK